MPRKTFSSVMVAALAVTMFGVQDSPVQAADGDFQLTILHTNDTHAHLDNIAETATLVEELRTDNPNNLLLSAGDVFSGTLYFNEFEGQADLAFMNYLNYDAMAFGNHEFDLGSSAEGHTALKNFISNAKFPFVAANIDFSADANLAALEASDSYTATAQDGTIYSGFVKEVNGEKIGIFGLTTEETVAISSPEDVAFQDYIKAAEEAVAWFESQGVNKIVALTHLGFDDSLNFDNDKELAESVEGIDVIVGGHTHTELTAPVVIDAGETDTVIVQAKQYNEVLGELDVTFDAEGKVTGFAGELHAVDPEIVTADPEVTALLKQYKDQIAELQTKEIGAVAEVELNGVKAEVRTGETNLGNLIADGLLAGARKVDPEVDLALTNGGGIRASIDAGPITYGEVLTVMPFGNSLAIMEITGAELKTALETSVGLYPDTNGGFLHVAGLSFNFDGKAPAGERVLSAYVESNGNWVEVDDTATYKVATNTFTAKGGDGYDVFAKAYEDGRVSEPGIIDYEMFIDHLLSLDEVYPVVEDRIDQVRLSGADRYETAIAVSQKGWESSDVVLIARGDVFADALAATPLAVAEDAPILLTRTGELDARVKAEIERLGAKKAIVLGGTGAISEEVVLQIKAALSGTNKVVARIGGKDRYETAEKIASRLGGFSNEAIIVNGTNFPDAISASSYAAAYGVPILLTRPNSLPVSTIEALEDIEFTTIIGGTMAVSEEVADLLPDPIRISGKDRYETSAAVAEEFFPDAEFSFAATGTSFADALSASTLAAWYEAPVLLVKPESVSDRVDAQTVNDFTVYATGGTKAISPAVLRELYEEAAE